MMTLKTSVLACNSSSWYTASTAQLYQRKPEFPGLRQDVFFMGYFKRFVENGMKMQFILSQKCFKIDDYVRSSKSPWKMSSVSKLHRNLKNSHTE